MNAFEFHGLTLEKTRGQWRGDCIFCGKEQHFFVNPKTEQWDCKVCGRSGNRYTFLQELHTRALEETTPQNYRQLGKQRELPAVVLKQHQLAYDGALGRWMLPVRNGTGGLANLKVYADGKLLSTPDCSLHLYNVNELIDSAQHKTVLVCEGEWDLIALDYVLGKLNLREDYVPVAVPGAAVFKDSWIKYFQSREVWLLFDCDEAGKEGMDRVEKMLQHTATVRRICWPEGSPPGQDIRDLLRLNKKHPGKVWEFLQAYLSAGAALRPSIVRNTYEEVLADFQSVYHVSESFEHALLTTLSTTISVRIPGDPIWMFLVGPPSIGKTTIIESFQGSPQCELLSKISATALISGWKGEEGRDVSLVPRLNHRTLMVKDYTAILSTAQQPQEEFYGLMRDLYDGFAKITFGNGEERIYKDIHFAFVAGVTDVIHRDNRATLGERFLKFNLHCSPDDESQQIQSAIREACTPTDGKKRLQEAVASFLEQTVIPATLPDVPQWYCQRVVAMSQLVAVLRARVHRQNGDLIYRPRPEGGSRVAKQLIKLGIAKAITLGRKRVDQYIWSLISQIAMDSSVGWNREIIQLLFLRPKGMRIKDISEELQISEAHTKRKLRDLQELHVTRYKRVSNGTGNRGTVAYLWFLDPHIHNLWQGAVGGE